MPDVHFPAVLVAAVAAFFLSSTWYALLGDRLAAVSNAASVGGRPAPWKVGVELLRSLVLATVLAGLASQGDIDEWTGGLLLGLALWVGFPVVLWTGAMIWEDTPWMLAAIHAGDWLVKLLVLAVIVSVWQ
jgi:hypothetical protein